MFKTKAIEIADKLMPAFNTPTGIPMAMVNGRTYVCALVFMLYIRDHCILMLSSTSRLFEDLYS